MEINTHCKWFQLNITRIKCEKLTGGHSPLGPSTSSWPTVKLTLLREVVLNSCLVSSDERWLLRIRRSDLEGGVTLTASSPYTSWATTSCACAKTVSKNKIKIVQKLCQKIRSRLCKNCVKKGRSRLARIKPGGELSRPDRRGSREPPPSLPAAHLQIPDHRKYHHDLNHLILHSWGKKKTNFALRTRILSRNFRFFKTQIS